ncbi:MAG: amidohydrolase [Gammaproteobacteria bacterium]
MTTDALVQLRHELHQHPELSGEEKLTAQRIVAFLEPLQPDSIYTSLGGHGVAAVFGKDTSTTVLLRCELDALPVHESNRFAHRSVTSCKAHSCGHDGHMAILAAVATRLTKQRPCAGRVVLLFQPAEETGQGAQAVVDDPQFQQLTPDYVFALHNLPGHPLGQVVIRDGPITAASRGMSIELTGVSAHAAHPETGRSPAPVLAALINALQPLPAELANPDEIAFSTIVGAQLGEKAFGTAPATAQLWLTLRSELDSTMQNFVAYAEQAVQQLAQQAGLTAAIHYADVFPATVNASAPVAMVKQAAMQQDLLVPEHPFRWSEDFGVLTARYPGALFGLGAGTEQADLHHSDYDFPDALITIGCSVFLNIIEQALTTPATG